MRRLFDTFKLISIFLALSTPLAAGPLVDKATEAEDLLRNGDPGGALMRMEEGVELAWDIGPLLIEKVLYVDAASGYGQYTERSEGSVFRPDEKLVIYVEPAGYGYGQLAIGLFEFGFHVDVEVAKSSGEVVVAKQDLMSISQSARAKAKEFYLKLTLTFPGMAVGTYDLYLRLRDQNSKKYAVFHLPLTIAE